MIAGPPGIPSTSAGFADAPSDLVTAAAILGLALILVLLVLTDRLKPRPAARRRDQADRSRPGG